MLRHCSSHSSQMYKLAEDIKCTAFTFIPSPISSLNHSDSYLQRNKCTPRHESPQKFTSPHVQFQLNIKYWWCIHLHCIALKLMKRMFSNGIMIHLVYISHNLCKWLMSSEEFLAEERFILKCTILHLYYVISKFIWFKSISSSSSSAAL